MQVTRSWRLGVLRLWFTEGHLARRAARIWVLLHKKNNNMEKNNNGIGHRPNDRNSAQDVHNEHTAAWACSNPGSLREQDRTNNGPHLAEAQRYLQYPLEQGQGLLKFPVRLNRNGEEEGQQVPYAGANRLCLRRHLSWVDPRPQLGSPISPLVGDVGMIETPALFRDGTYEFAQMQVGRREQVFSPQGQSGAI